MWYSFVSTFEDDAIVPGGTNSNNGSCGDTSPTADITSSGNGVAPVCWRRSPYDGHGIANPSSASCLPADATTAAPFGGFGSPSLIKRAASCSGASGCVSTPPSYAAVTAAFTPGAAASVPSGAGSYSCPPLGTGTHTTRDIRHHL